MDDSETRRRLDVLRQGAAGRLDALAEQLDEIAHARRDANSDDEHDPEGSTLAFDRAQVSALAADARRQLEEVDAAFARLDDGTYGVCARCGAPIGAGRLEVRPTARFCVACQVRAERPRD